MELTLFRIIIAISGILWTVHLSGEGSHWAAFFGLACCIFSHYCGWSDRKREDPNEYVN